MDIPLVLSNYYKGQNWSLNGENYEGLLWSDENTLPKPTLEELTNKYDEHRAAQPLRELRTKRNAVLEQTDRYATIDYPHPTEEVKQAWLDYRQALRDLPVNTTDPENPVWPEAPTPYLN
jgi:hypothetical protein